MGISSVCLTNNKTTQHHRIGKWYLRGTGTFLVNVLGVHGQACIFLLTGSWAGPMARESHAWAYTLWHLSLLNQTRGPILHNLWVIMQGSPLNIRVGLNSAFLFPPNGKEIPAHEPLGAHKLYPSHNTTQIYEVETGEIMKKVRRNPRIVLGGWLCNGRGGAFGRHLETFSQSRVAPEKMFIVWGILLWY